MPRSKPLPDEQTTRLPPKKTIQPEEMAAVQAVNTLLGHNNPPASDEDLIAENFKLEDLNKAAMLKLKDWKAPNDARIKEIENELLRRLQERKADSTSTDSGTAYISNPMDHKVEDPAKFFDWVAENWDEIAADVKLGISVAAVRAFMERNKRAPPPGVKVDYYTSLNIRRS